MKTEQRKKEDCELLDAFLGLTKANPLRTLEEDLDKFKADNDLLPKTIELSKEDWNERIGEEQVNINELEEKLNELRKLV